VDEGDVDGECLPFPLQPPCPVVSCARPVSPSRVRVTGRTVVDAVYPSQTHFPAVIGRIN